MYVFLSVFEKVKKYVFACNFLKTSPMELKTCAKKSCNRSGFSPKILSKSVVFSKIYDIFRLVHFFFRPHGSILSLFKKRNKKPVPLSPASAMKDLSLDWVFNIESKRTFKSYMPCRTVYIFLKRNFFEKYCLLCFDIPRPAAGADFFWIFGRRPPLPIYF